MFWVLGSGFASRTFRVLCARYASAFGARLRRAFGVQGSGFASRTFRVLGSLRERSGFWVRFANVPGSGFASRTFRVLCARLRSRVQSFGFRVMGLENFFIRFFIDNQLYLSGIVMTYLQTNFR
jgi:hypothetical protein